jgi:AcrR family transcriptional regulator
LFVNRHTGAMPDPDRPSVRPSREDREDRDDRADWADRDDWADRAGRRRSSGRRARRDHRGGSEHSERRTQAQRSAETRTKLLDATAAGLAEHGYAHISTTDICRRAGVSRGAMLHHFPSKAVLVAAACDHVFQLSVEEFRAAMAAVPAGDDRLSAAIDTLWELYQGDTIAAWFELIVAGRTDPDLQPHVALVTARLTETVRVTWNELFGVSPDATAAEAESFATAPLLMFAVLDGLAVSRMTGQPTAASDAASVLALVKAAAAHIVPLLDPPSATPSRRPPTPEEQP